MKKIRQIIQQLNPFGEQNKPEQQTVPVEPVQPLMETVQVGETVEVMILEEYLRQAAEIPAENPDIIDEAYNQAAYSLSFEPEASMDSQNIVNLPKQGSTVEEGKNSEGNSPTEPENPEQVSEKTEVEISDDKEPGNEIITTEEPDKELSLSENKPFAKLAEECTDLMNEFDGYVERLETVEGKMMAEMVVKRMQELLERAGLERIDDESEFSVLRHTPVPMQIVQEGTPIVETRFPGLALGNRVYRKATVKIYSLNHKNLHD
jgi:molecular chaperone GrpE (heat shock protein)